jgi:hypothetical protein
MGEPAARTGPICDSILLLHPRDATARHATPTRPPPPSCRHLWCPARSQCRHQNVAEDRNLYAHLSLSLSAPASATVYDAMMPQASNMPASTAAPAGPGPKDSRGMGGCGGVAAAGRAHVGLHSAAALRRPGRLAGPQATSEGRAGCPSPDLCTTGGRAGGLMAAALNRTACVCENNMATIAKWRCNSSDGAL